MKIRLKSIRESCKISQNALAKQIGVSVPYLCRVEKGIQPISISIALDIADYFGVSLDDLFGRKSNVKFRKED